MLVYTEHIIWGKQYTDISC